MTHSLRDKKTVAGFMAFLMVCLFLVPSNVTRAKDVFLSNYQQTVYNQQNGLESNEVNCLYQSSSGYVWVGTDGGLYRSKGAEFTSINLWDSEQRTEVYVVNCITQDSRGRMWIGTDNYGLFIIENGQTYHFQEEYYAGVKQINSICETSSGIIYIATAQGLFTYYTDEEGEERLVQYRDSNTANIGFSKIVAVDNDVWALYGSSSIFILGGDAYKGSIKTSDIISDELNSMCAVDGSVYVGSTGRDIIKFSGAADYEIITTGVETINTVMQDDKGRLWVGADSGIGYMYDGKFVRLYESAVDSYISAAIQDYEGNYWFASTRMGLMLLSRNKFQDFNMQTGMDETMVNAVCEKDGNRYIGTEDGLFIYDADNKRIKNELTDFLRDVSIRDIMFDTEGNMWISAYRRYGMVKFDKDGVISYFGKLAGLPSSVTNCSLELRDGNIAVATENGIAIINKKGSVLKTFTEDMGLTHSNITCLYQLDSGTLLAGSDGGGLYSVNINSEKIVNIGTEEGLNSENVLVIAGGNEGIWIGTDNGLCFYNESFRAVSNIEYTNSIYDIVIDGEQTIIISSMGVLLTSETELMGSQGISGRYYNSNDGLSMTLNNISHSYLDESGKLYLCCNTGICTIDTENVPQNLVPPKMRVTSVDVDGKVYQFDDLAGSLKVASDTSRITIDFDVFSYTNRDNIQVEYYLDGFDDKPIVINGNEVMRAVYTNLDGGEYEFVIKAYNGDGTASEGEVSFTIEKENSFFENKWARLIIIAGVFIVLLISVFVIIKVLKILKTKNTALEQLSKEHEQAMKSSSAKNDYLANMSNEIKTPINAIVSRADELMRLTPAEDERSVLIRNIYDTGNDIIETVDDIILLAKIEAEKVSVTNAPYSVSQLIYDLSEEAAGKIGDRPIKLFVELGDDTQEYLVGDIDKIKDILYRILENALKFTKEGSITLSVDCYSYSGKSGSDNMVNIIFSVADTGIGMQEDKLENIFEVSNIADNMKSSHSGIGVGLAIAKGYADLIGAELEVDSIYGAGSTFTLSLNQKVASASGVVNMMTKIESRVSKEEAEKLWLPDVKVLVVDNDEISLEVACKVFEKLEVKVATATTGISAIDMVLNGEYDAVFMDISMPVMNGTDAMREIRELNGEGYDYLPIIAMNTDAIEENKDSLLEAGFTDSLLKPVELRRVAAILKDCLPADKIKERPNEENKYVLGPRYMDGIEMLRPVLDVESALDKIGGSIEVYNKLITIFYNQNVNAKKELTEKRSRDFRGFKTKIHSIKTNSINIGATELANETTKIEAAININNKDYIKDNIDTVITQLENIFDLIEEYKSFIDTVYEMSDEEYLANKKLLEAEQDKVSSDTNEAQKASYVDEAPNTIDIMRLENIKYTALDGEYDAVREELAILEKNDYLGEDKEFMEVLKKAIKEEDTTTINELVTTYIDLKAIK